MTFSRITIFILFLVTVINLHFSQQCCTDEEFQCRNGNCAPLGYACDGDNDCGDWSDEECYQCGGKDSYQKGFECADTGMCLSDSSICDGVQDCEDNTDEKDCQVDCPPEEYVCDNNRECVTEEVICDGNRDCSDESDEKYCSCSSNQYECEKESGPVRCIPERWVCDGDKDCPNGDDEEQPCCFSKTFACNLSRIYTSDEPKETKNVPTVLLFASKRLSNPLSTSEQKTETKNRRK